MLRCVICSLAYFTLISRSLSRIGRKMLASRKLGSGIPEKYRCNWWSALITACGDRRRTQAKAVNAPLVIDMDMDSRTRGAIACQRTDYAASKA